MALPLFQATGNLTADPELKFTQQGAARVGMRLACGERKKNQQTGEWEDGDTTFISVVAWRNLAENVAESLRKGDTVTVIGRLKSRTVEDDERGKATFYEVDAQDISVSLARATAKPIRVTGATPANIPADDPWATQSSDIPF